MPTSDVGLVPVVVREMQRLQPRSVLDIGVGFGKWGYLAREYLEVWQGRLSRREWTIRVDGIEAFPAYRNPLWDWVYDNIHLGDVRQLVDTVGSYDLVLMCDVIEHMDKPSAASVVRALFKRSRTMIVTTPTTFWAQEAENGNPFERHVSFWHPIDFHALGARTIELPGQLLAIFSHGGPAAGTHARWLDDVGVRPLARALVKRLAVQTIALVRPPHGDSR